MRAEVELIDWADILDTLYSLVARNVRYFTANGCPNLYGGRFAYRPEAPNKCGAEKWQVYRDIVKQPQGPPFLVECEEAGTLECARLLASGEDPAARLRLIQLGPTVHVQVVSRGKVLDPSHKLGMKIPRELRGKIYDLNFLGEA